VGDVLLDFNGQAITDSDSLKQFLASQDPQQVFRMRYFRNGVQADAVFTVRGGDCEKSVCGGVGGRCPGAGGCAFQGGVNPNHFKYESRL
jgi:hypothetical protein